MRLQTEIFGDVLVAHAPDDLVEETVDALIRTVQSAIEDGQVKVVAQLDRTETYDSAALSALLDLRDELRKAGGNLKVCGLGEPGRTIFRITRLNREVDVFDSVIDAVSSYR